MASLRAFLPSAGGTVWRNERRTTRTSSSGDGEHGITRIKHIVIREVWKKIIPSPHALYKVDVMTQSNHWIILRRYREFHSLHQNLVKQYGIPNDMLPSKTISSTMALDHLEKRRNALEHYLQRLINSHHDIAESKELFEFLNVETHDVLCVTRQLSRTLEKEGRNILSSSSVFTFTPTQMYCITRQLQLPSVSTTEDGLFMDLGYLYGFIQELCSLCVSASKSSLCEELISNQAFDISHFKSLEKLQIDKCHISVIDGLFRIQKQLTHVTVRDSLKTMKEFLVDCAMQKRTVHQANINVESWRNFSTTKLTENRIVVRPWILLTHLNMSHNKIVTFDHSLRLMPALEQLDLSFNTFSHLDLSQLTSSTLTFLNISHNNIHYISATTKDVMNVKSLLLSHNKLQSLDGLDCLRGLVELDIRDNEIKRIEELAKISSLLHLRILAMTGNQCVASKSHRINVFSQMKARELILDGVKINDTEKKKVQQEQQRRTQALVVEVGEPSTRIQYLQKVEIERDDDQDSGFGGNFSGSIDDGGLVFYWGCYGNMASVPSQSHRGGPSGRYQGVSSNKGRHLKGRDSNLVIAPETAPPLLINRHTHGGHRIDKGKGPLRGQRPENRKNIGKSSAKSDTRSNSVSSVSRTEASEISDNVVSDVWKCENTEDKEIRSGENHSKSVSGRIISMEGYNPFLDNALVLPEDNGTRVGVMIGDPSGSGGMVGGVDTTSLSVKDGDDNDNLVSKDNGTRVGVMIGDEHSRSLDNDRDVLGSLGDFVNSSQISEDNGSDVQSVNGDCHSSQISEDNGAPPVQVMIGDNDTTSISTNDGDDHLKPTPEDNGTRVDGVNGDCSKPLSVKDDDVYSTSEDNYSTVSEDMIGDADTTYCSVNDGDDHSDLISEDNSTGIEAMITGDCSRSPSVNRNDDVNTTSDDNYGTVSEDMVGDADTTYFSANSGDDNVYSTSEDTSTGIEDDDMVIAHDKS